MTEGKNMKIEKKKLKNGATIIGAKIDGAKTFTVAFGFRIGSRAESGELSGITHFLEHMLFKGSKNRPRAKDISTVIDRMGANYNAFTSKEYTYYYINTAVENFDLALDVLGDMVTSPLLDPRELEKEKGTIVEEIKMYEDNPMFSVYGKMEQTLFGEDNPLGREIAGTEKTVLGSDSTMMEKYFKKNYIAQNAIAVLTGNLPEGYQEKIGKYLKILPQGEVSSWEFSGFSQNRMKIIKKETEQAHFGICFPGYSLASQKRYPAEVLATILGGYMSSRLFTEIREKRGWAYRVLSYNESLSDTGYFGIYGGIKLDKIVDAINITKNEVFNISKNLKDEEIERAKNHIAGSSALRYESSFNLAVQLGLSFLLLGKEESPEENLNHILSVTKEDIISVAEELFLPENLYLTVIGPFQNDSKFAKITN